MNLCSARAHDETGCGDRDASPGRIATWEGAAAAGGT
jgi:hypothetical protein